MSKKEKSQDEMRKVLKHLTNPKKVLESPTIISGKKLLRISHDLGLYPYEEKMTREQ